jgi:hypothetical protein
MYGLDILVDEKDKKYTLIDLNYFPGFKEFKNMQSSFYNNICKKL